MFQLGAVSCKETELCSEPIVKSTTSHTLDLSMCSKDARLRVIIYIIFLDGEVDHFITKFLPKTRNLRWRCPPSCIVYLWMHFLFNQSLVFMIRGADRPFITFEL